MTKILKNPGRINRVPLLTFDDARQGDYSWLFSSDINKWIKGKRYTQEDKQKHYEATRDERSKPYKYSKRKITADYEAEQD